MFYNMGYYKLVTKPHRYVWEYVQCVEQPAILLNIDGLAWALDVPALINIPYSI